ncbi:MAG: caspase family protein [Rubrivivax sp.]|nr:caspase family protein [Rubrivivax sp.]
MRAPADSPAAPGRVLPSPRPGIDGGAPRRAALVIGNGAYRSITPLRNPANDAQDMCDALRRQGFQTQCHQDLASREDFRRVLRQFSAQLGPGSVALMYYAGHGVQRGGRNFLLPTGIAPAAADDVERDSLPMDEVYALLRESLPELSIVILDACRDDPFADPRGARHPRGLAREEPPRGSVLVYATAPGGAAADGSGRNGLFTKHLLAEIDKPGPQIGQMLHNVARAVELEARTRYGTDQVPYRSFSYTGAFCFNSCDEDRIADQMEQLRRQSQAAAQRIRELESQASGGRGGEIEALQTRLRELGEKSAQLETLRQRIAALEREAREREQEKVDMVRKEQERRSRPTFVPTF